MPPVPIRWVLVRDPKGRLEPQAFLSTDMEAAPIQILLWFRQRWQVEVTFEQVRAHLRVETLGTSVTGSTSFALDGNGLVSQIVADRC